MLLADLDDFELMKCACPFLGGSHLHLHFSLKLEPDLLSVEGKRSLRLKCFVFDLSLFEPLPGFLHAFFSLHFSVELGDSLLKCGGVGGMLAVELLLQALHFFEMKGAHSLHFPLVRCLQLAYFLLRCVVLLLQILLQRH